MKKIKVLCGLIFNTKDELLITRRLGGEFSGKWEFPGGKLEENESEQDCLIREIKEELDIDIIVNSFFMRNEHTYPEFSVELISYLSTFIGGNIKLVDHDKYEWVETSRLKEFDFLDGDIPIINNIVSNNISIPS